MKIPIDNKPQERVNTDELAELQELWQATLTNESIHLHEEAIIAHLSTIVPLEPQQASTTHDSFERETTFYKSSKRTSFMTTLLAILQNRERFINSILQASGNLHLMALSLLTISGLSFFVYGFVLGAQHSILQALSSAVKLPLLFLCTIIITFPTLFIFGSLIGINRTFMQTLVILLAGTAIISLALVALSPVTLLFGMTTSSYAFFKLLNVGIFIVAWFLGAAFFRAIYAPTVEAGTRIVKKPLVTFNEVEENIAENTEASLEQVSQVLTAEQAESHTKVQSYFIRFWFLLYGFVAVQIAWMLRPFVCSSTLEFQLLRGMRDNVYGDILYSIAHILGFR